MKIQTIFFEDWDAWKWGSLPSTHACVNELKEARARNGKFSCSKLFNYSYFFGMYSVRLISSISDYAWVRIRGQHSLRTNQWNHPVLGCVTASDTFPLPTNPLTKSKRASCLSEPSWAGVVHWWGQPSFPKEQPGSRGLFMRCFRAFAVKEGSSVISWLSGDRPNH